MAGQARVQVLEEVFLERENGWRLCFQWCRYIYDDGHLNEGYRFIWRREDGSLQAARGQARIPSLDVASRLIEMARSQNWGHHTGSSNTELLGRAAQ